jgi:hypothetical protein
MAPSRASTAQAVHHEDAAAETGAAAGVQVAVAEAAGDDRSRCFTAAASESAASARIAGARGAAPGGEARDPGEAQVFDGGSVDALERAVALARVVARVGGPLVPGSELLQDFRGIQARLAEHRDRREQK